MNNQLDKSIKDKLLAEINAGKIKMRPHWHFAMKTTLLVTGFLLSLLTGIFIVSFIVFVMRQSGIWFLPGMGGFGLVLINLPWVLIMVAIAFIVILEFFAKKHSVGYRKPMLYSTLGVIAMVLVGGFLVDQTALHGNLFRMAHDSRMPISGGFYRQFGNPSHRGNFASGIVTAQTEFGLIIQNPRGENIEVVIDESTDNPQNSELMIGSRIVISGKKTKSTIQAQRIRIIELEEYPPQFRLKHSPGQMKSEMK